MSTNFENDDIENMACSKWRTNALIVTILFSMLGIGSFVMVMVGVSYTPDATISISCDFSTINPQMNGTGVVLVDQATNPMYKFYGNNTNVTFIPNKYVAYLIPKENVENFMDSDWYMTMFLSSGFNYDSEIIQNIRSDLEDQDETGIYTIEKLIIPNQTNIWEFKYSSNFNIIITVEFILDVDGIPSYVPLSPRFTYILLNGEKIGVNNHNGILFELQRGKSINFEITNFTMNTDDFNNMMYLYQIGGYRYNEQGFSVPSYPLLMKSTISYSRRLF